MSHLTIVFDTLGSLGSRARVLGRAAALTALAVFGMADPPVASAGQPGPELAATFSIVARDPVTGDLGVAVQSHWFSVGSVVAWAEAGVGAVATQSFVEVAYGPRLLQRLASGEGPSEALQRLLEADASRAVRQVAVIDAEGRIAAHTGESCITFAGDTQGVDYSCQGNLLASAEVWAAMGRAFESSEGRPLADRLLRALEAGQAAGGDARGMQSASLLVVRPVSDTEPWKNRRIDLRVEDAADPIAEIRRLYTVWQAYDLANQGDEHLATNDYEAAYRSYDAALALLPENDELLFWRGSMGYTTGQPERALGDVKRAIELNPRWKMLLPRLDAAIFPGVDEVCAKLGIPRGPNGVSR